MSDLVDRSLLDDPETTLTRLLELRDHPKAEFKRIYWDVAKRRVKALNETDIPPGSTLEALILARLPAPK